MLSRDLFLYDGNPFFHSCTQFYYCCISFPMSTGDGDALERTCTHETMKSKNVTERMQNEKHKR